MKTLTLFFFIVFTTLTANAQITKGNWMVGGSAYFGSVKSESSGNGFNSDSKASGLGIAPNLGYFIKDKFVIGVSPTFNFSNPGGPNNNGTSFGIGPFIRYYFLKPENKVNLLAQARYGFSKAKSQSSSGSNTNGYDFKAGPVIYFNSSVGLEFTLDYSYSRNKSNNSDNVSIYKNINLGIGFQIHLEK